MTLLILIVLGASLYLVVSRYVASAGEQRVNQRIDTVEDGLRSNLRPNQVSLGIIFGGPSAGTWAYIIVSGSPPYTPTETYVAGNVLPDMASVAIAETGKTDARVVTVSASAATASYAPVPVRPTARLLRPGRQNQKRRDEACSHAVPYSARRWSLASARFAAAGYLYAGRALVPIRARSPGGRRRFCGSASSRPTPATN